MFLDVDRWDVLKRFAVTLVCMIVFELVRLLMYASTFFQFAYVLITRKSSEPLRSFSNRLADFGYRIMRFISLNSNERLFPFSDFPAERDCERPVDKPEF